MWEDDVADILSFLREFKHTWSVLIEQQADALKRMQRSRLAR